MVLAEEFRTEKYRILALDKVHIKGVISLSPDSFIFSYIEKCQINLRYRGLFFFLIVWVYAQSCLTLCCSLPGSSVHRIFQARILKQVVISPSRGSSWPRDWTHVSCISITGRQIFYHCVIREDLVFKWQLSFNGQLLTCFCFLKNVYVSLFLSCLSKTVSQSYLRLKFSPHKT